MKTMSMILPTDLGQFWNVPYRRNPFFTGRENIFTELHHSFFASHPQAHHPLLMQIITGPSGIGKTQTAVEYAYRYRDSYQAVLWLNAGTREAFRQSVMELAQLLHLPNQEVQDQAFLHWLAVHDKWLLILDSVALSDNWEILAMFPDPFSSPARGHVLLTQQSAIASPSRPLLELGSLTELEGAHLLLQRAGKLARSAPFDAVPVAQRTTAAKIATELGGLPLALDLAGASIEESGSGLASYLQHYHTAVAQPRAEIQMQALATVCAISVAQVKLISPVAADILHLCAFLAPDMIPEELFIRGAPELGPRLRPLALNTLLLDAAIATLRAYALIRCDVKAKTIALHPLLQMLLKESLSPALRRLCADRVVRALARILRHPSEATNRARSQLTLLHAHACVDLIRQEALTSPEAIELQRRYDAYQQLYALSSMRNPP